MKIYVKYYCFVNNNNLLKSMHTCDGLDGTLAGWTTSMFGSGEADDPDVVDDPKMSFSSSSCWLKGFLVTLPWAVRTI